ncbi:hypothetical protein HHE03_10550 [Helicobacter heilmannii]|uniref:hypothetical protein n=1 Tax=Helicobacter heilmannii TaxID=35817 RepID=UPI0006A017D0|nr:hypothetical protein [Helicobacter heilmannii]CRF49440.1 hypothetical protein HHE03_10550 [Helicobacter heilmannii]
MKTRKYPFSLALVASLSLSSFALADNTNNSQAAMIVNSLSGLLGSTYMINSSGYAYPTNQNIAPIYENTSAEKPLTLDNGPIGNNTPADPTPSLSLMNSNYDLTAYNLFPSGDYPFSQNSSQQDRINCIVNSGSCNGVSFDGLLGLLLDNQNTNTNPYALSSSSLKSFQIPFASRAATTTTAPTRTIAIKDLIQAYQASLDFNGGGGNPLLLKRG